MKHNRDMYPTAFQGEALATLSRIVIIGTFAGVVVSVVLAIVLNSFSTVAKKFWS